jgi:hypothetical protein
MRFTISSIFSNSLSRVLLVTKPEHDISYLLTFVIESGHSSRQKTKGVCN